MEDILPFFLLCIPPSSLLLASVNFPFVMLLINCQEEVSLEECLKKCDKVGIVWKMSQEVVWVGREYDKYIRRKNLRTFFKLLECVAPDTRRPQTLNCLLILPAGWFIIGNFYDTDADHSNKLEDHQSNVKKGLFCYLMIATEPLFICDDGFETLY